MVTEKKGTHYSMERTGPDQNGTRLNINFVLHTAHITAKSGIVCWNASALVANCDTVWTVSKAFQSVTLTNYSLKNNSQKEAHILLCHSVWEDQMHRIWNWNTVNSNDLLDLRLDIIRPGKLDLLFSINTCFHWDLPPQLHLPRMKCPLLMP